MSIKRSSLRVRLYLAGVLIFVAGLTAAALVYWKAGDDINNALSYEYIGGNVYPVEPQDSKRYIHDIELYGGKAAVVVDEIDRWLASLWHGRRLAYTLVIVSIGAALACFFAADRLSDALSPDNSKDQEG
jgi:hypothetical protein